MSRVPPYVFVLGAPGAGKGTQCALLRQEFSLEHLSAGELLRQHIDSGRENAAFLARIINEGRIVPSEVCCADDCEAVIHACISSPNQGPCRSLLDCCCKRCSAQPRACA
jgi:Adenylate kinase